MRILILDNYDSFTYNLYHYARLFCANVTVKRNDEISLEDVDEYSHIILSPGPGLPNNAGILMDVLKHYAHRKPILGICLGMQAMALHFGGSLYNQKKVKHGIQEVIDVDLNFTLFKNLPTKVKVGLYHSWAVSEEDLPKDLQVTARSAHGVIMGLQHNSIPICGVQFHPESILTDFGKEMIGNWLNKK